MDKRSQKYKRLTIVIVYNTQKEFLYNINMQEIQTVTDRILTELPTRFGKNAFVRVYKVYSKSGINSKITVA